MVTGLELTFMGVTWSNSGLFSTLVFVVSRVGIKRKGRKRKKRREGGKKGIEKERKGRKEEGIDRDRRQDKKEF